MVFGKVIVKPMWVSLRPNDAAIKMLGLMRHSALSRRCLAIEADPLYGQEQGGTSSQLRQRRGREQVARLVLVSNGEMHKKWDWLLVQP
jgi:hypothetical protein